MHTIRRIDVYSLSKTLGLITTLIFAAVGLLRLFTFVFLGSLPTFPIYYTPSDPAEMSIAVALINYVLGIIITFSTSAFFGGLLAWIYNLLVPYAGGMQVQID